MFSIFVILETEFQGRAELHQLKDMVIEKVHWIFKDYHEQYKHAFNELVREKLISVTEYHPKKVISNSSEFIHFLKRYKREYGTEFQVVCQELFHLYERKEVTDIKLTNIVSIFQIQKAKCENLNCRKFFFPHKYSKRYCPECYKELFEKPCPLCIKKNNPNPNLIMGREKMCTNCKEEKSKELQTILNIPKICKCRICKKEFEGVSKRASICKECFDKYGKDVKLCPKCEKEIIFWSQNKCSYCVAEELGYTNIDKNNKTAIRKCEKCNRPFQVDCSKRGWLTIKKCSDCHGYQPKTNREHPMCKCGERHLKGRQKICKVCKKKAIAEKNEISLCKRCNNEFKPFYGSEFCKDCQKLRKSGQKMCLKCKEFAFLQKGNDFCTTCNLKAQGFEVDIKENVYLRPCDICKEIMTIEIGSTKRTCDKCKKQPIVKNAKKIKIEKINNNGNITVTIKFDDKIYELINKLLKRIV
jgi:hypothetical protein